MDRFELIRFLKAYATPFKEEVKFINDFIILLEHPRAFHRDHLPGHITGSAWITDEHQQHVLLTHHAKLNRWLQPGGHADGDEDVLHVALKEAEEETGIQHFILPSKQIFDIDIHSIPERNGFPEHLHYDIRFHLQTSLTNVVTITEESHDLKWIPLSDVGLKSNNNRSMLRMVEKLIKS